MQRFSLGGVLLKFYISAALPAWLSLCVEEIEQRFQIKSRSVPHMTVVAPRLLKANVIDTDLYRALENCVREIPSFLLTLEGVGYFDDFAHVVIEVERSNNLIVCHQILSRACDPFLEVDAGPYADLSSPHIILGNKLSPDSGRRIYETLKDEDFSESFMCSELRVLSREDDAPMWTTEAILTLDP